MVENKEVTRWWFQTFFIFYFHPYLGKIPILTNIFQMGWNHQLGKCGYFTPISYFSGVISLLIYNWFSGAHLARCMVMLRTFRRSSMMAWQTFMRLVFPLCRCLFVKGGCPQGAPMRDELLVATGHSNVTIHDQRFCEGAGVYGHEHLLFAPSGPYSGVGHFAALVLPQPTRNDVRTFLRKTRVFLEGKMRMGRNVIENAIGAAALFPILRVPILVHWAGLVSDSDPWSMVNQTGLQNNFTNSLC